MVPFYGQGMNAGMEDVRILFSILDKHLAVGEGKHLDEPYLDQTSWRFQALAEYSVIRAPDAHAINDLALQNYIEMRASVLSTRYQLRKFLEEFMSVNFPHLGWQTRYARVSFSNEGYSDVVRKSEDQGRVLVRAFLALVTSPVILTIGLSLYKYRRISWRFINSLFQ